jgi:hypothetical protein
MIRPLLGIPGSRRVAPDGTVQRLAVAIVLPAGATPVAFARSRPLQKKRRAAWTVCGGSKV